MKHFILAVCFLGSYSMLSAATIYVAGDATGANDGSSWIDAFVDLQDAIDAVDPDDADGIDQIWVKAGTYHPTRNVFGDPLGGDPFDPGNIVTQSELTFLIGTSVEIYGGFNGTEALLRDRNIDANPTILSGDFDSGSVSDNVNRVVWIQDVTTFATLGDVVLDGFTITGGTDRGNVGGGGIYLFNVDPIELSNLTITECSATEDGGGLYIYAPNVITIRDLTIENCTSGDRGGGLYLQNTSATAILDIEGLELRNNSATTYGGGAYLRVLTACEITNALIVNNTSGNEGGGICARGQNSVDNINILITHATFYGNTAAGYGGGIFTEVSAGIQMYNSIFYANSDQTGSTTPTSQIARWSASINEIAHCLIQGSGGSSAWTLNSGDDMGNNIDADPLFEDPDGADDILGNEDDNFGLTINSPANNVGTSSVPDLATYPSFDLANDIRIQSTAPDLGAIEGPFGTSFPVEWLSFEGVLQAVDAKDEVALFWQTAQEVQSSHFVIQRRVGESSGKSDTWAAIGETMAAGNSETIQSYNFTDRDIDYLPNGTRLYYRIQQVDFDGASSYSQVLSFIKEEIARADMHIYPNPAVDNATLRLNFDQQPQMATVSLRNLQGQQVWERSISPASALQVTLPTANLPVGVYSVEVQYDGKRLHDMIQVK